MKKINWILLGLALIALASVSAFGQDKAAAAQDRQATLERGLTMATQGQGPGPVTVDGNTFVFVNSEFSFDRLVKGAPYSAQAVTESTQVLSDGNRIVNSNTASVYRDSEGRTRREQTLKSIGNFSASSEAFKTISINDPVTGVGYVLEPHSHMARKIGGFRIEAGQKAAPFTIAQAEEGGNFTFNRTVDGEVRVKAASADSKMREEKERTNYRREDLGTQTIEGVSAVGTRTTLTIPVGQVGNERPIEIIDERWFSPDLQTIVMTRHADPRSGETVYRLTNINRAEPDHSLFEVPADFTLKDDHPMKVRLSPDKLDQDDQMIP